MTMPTDRSSSSSLRSRPAPSSFAALPRSLVRMAAKVDAQNAGDPVYRPMSGHPDSFAWQVFDAKVASARRGEVAVDAID